MSVVSLLVGGALSGGTVSTSSAAEGAIVRERLRTHVRVLATDIGERNLPHLDRLERARDYVAEQFRLGGHAPSLQSYSHRGETFHNVEAVLDGSASPNESIVVGAHYDSVEGSPGANDNASGVATLLELARSLANRPQPMTVRFVAFANEEPPYFNTGEGMGSVEYVKRLDDPGRRVRAMLSLETVGYYDERPGSQRYPTLVGLFYPDRGDFIGFVGNWGSRRVLRTVLDTFRAATTLPSEGATLPAFVPGVAWSDHRSFWDAGVPAVMVTDTAPFRDPYYHTPRDTPERLDYDRMARLVTGLARVVESLARDDR